MNHFQILGSRILRHPHWCHVQNPWGKCKWEQKPTITRVNKKAIESQYWTESLESRVMSCGKNLVSLHLFLWSSRRDVPHINSCNVFLALQVFNTRPAAPAFAVRGWMMKNYCWAYEPKCAKLGETAHGLFEQYVWLLLISYDLRNNSTH